VTTSDALKASVTGASAVTYSGNPKTVDKDVEGASSIRQNNCEISECKPVVLVQPGG
jgi:hypothetical protein